MTLPSSVRRRHVCYVSGFDPNGPARYHKLYSEGARQQSHPGAAQLEVGARHRRDTDTMDWRLRWHPAAAGPAAAPDAEPEVETGYVFPRWDPVIRDYWWQAQWPQLADLFRTSWLYLRTGALWKMARQCWPAFVSVFAPFFLLLVMLPGAALLLYTGLALVQAWHTQQALAAPLIRLAVLLLMAALWSYHARHHWHAQWILRSYAFVGRLPGGGVPALEARLDAMAAGLCRQVREGGDDEVLVVGHSLGTIMAVSVLARALQQDPELARRGPAIGLLTLGHCIPLLSNLPAAGRFRAELALLAATPEICWVDFSDPLDDYSFAGVNPLQAAGLAGAPGHPQLRSPGFFRLFEPGPDQAAPMNMHEIHQQYLRPGRPGGDYDFFAITAGPLSLAQRFRGG